MCKDQKDADLEVVVGEIGDGSEAVVVDVGHGVGEQHRGGGPQEQAVTCHGRVIVQGPQQVDSLSAPAITTCI